MSITDHVNPYDGPLKQRILALMAQEELRRRSRVCRTDSARGKGPSTVAKAGSLPTPSSDQTPSYRPGELLVGMVAESARKRNPE